MQLGRRFVRPHRNLLRFVGTGFTSEVQGELKLENAIFAGPILRKPSSHELCHRIRPAVNRNLFVEMIWLAQTCRGQQRDWLRFGSCRRCHGSDKRTYSALLAAAF